MLLVEQFAAVALNVADYGYVMRHHSESATRPR
jgi:ABC-type branched-subunit amino acid transport system ATPase component